MFPRKRTVHCLASITKSRSVSTTRVLPPTAPLPTPLLLEYFVNEQHHLIKDDPPRNLLT